MGELKDLTNRIDPASLAELQELGLVRRNCVLLLDL